jgi:dihydrofolate synthase/folylpolyglutamate synthase
MDDDVRRFRAAIENDEDAAEFLLSLVRADPRPYGARAELPRLPVVDLLERLGDPHDGLHVVHIAGSKGKGSTALLLESILQGAGLLTGTFTSPHLQRWTERYRLGGRELAPERFASIMERLRLPVRDLYAEDPETAPSFFDVLTAAALTLFAEARVDCAIIETGIGGRLDATSVVQPRLCCITSVELEHTDKLGDTLAAVAGEKAGIMKAGVPVITAPLPHPADQVVRARARALAAPLAALGKEIDFRIQAGGEHTVSLSVDGREQRHECTLPPGTAPCMAQNAALAVAAADRLELACPRPLAAAIVDALAGARLPGRLELLAERPWIVVDGAHTRASVGALCHMLDGLPAARTRLVVSVSGSKDPGAVLAPLLERADEVIVTSAEPLRSMDADSLAHHLARHLATGGFRHHRIRSIADPRLAIAQGRRSLQSDHVLCVAGSMYLAGVAREALGAGEAVRGAAP